MPRVRRGELYGVQVGTSPYFNMSSDKKIEKIENRLAICRKAASDNLGIGFWSLNPEENHRFTHDEIIFLFARILNVLNFDYIETIRQEFPDCIAVQNNSRRFIEFEPYLSNFNHLKEIENGIKCDCIICWENDLDNYSSLKENLENRNIEIIELKSIWSEIKTKIPKKGFYYTKSDFERMKRNRLLVLSAFIKLNKNLLSKKEISDEIGIKGKSLGGSLTGHFQEKNKDWIIKHSHGLYKFNEKYRALLLQVLKEDEII